MIKNIFQRVSKAFTSRYPIVAHLHIGGEVNSQDAKVVIDGLKRCIPSSVAALAVTINTVGGSPAQAIIIAERVI